MTLPLIKKKTMQASLSLKRVQTSHMKFGKLKLHVVECLTLKCHFGLNRPTFATNMDCSDYNLQVMDVNEKTYKIDIDVLALTSFSGWLNVSQNNKTGSTLSGEIPAILLVHTTVLCGPLRVSCSETMKTLKLPAAVWERDWRL